MVDSTQASVWPYSEVAELRAACAAMRQALERRVLGEHGCDLCGSRDGHDAGCALATDAGAALLERLAKAEKEESACRANWAVLTQLHAQMIAKCERALASRRRWFDRWRTLADRLRSYHSDDPTRFDDTREELAAYGTKALNVLREWVQRSRVEAEEKGGIFDTIFRCVSEGGEVFYFDPEEVADYMDERDRLLLAAQSLSRRWREERKTAKSAIDALAAEDRIADADALRAERDARDRKYRERLFLSHGHPFAALYGDDGEMQCHACPADFKRDPLEKLEECELHARALLSAPAERPDPRTLCHDQTRPDCHGCAREATCVASGRGPSESHPAPAESTFAMGLPKNCPLDHHPCEGQGTYAQCAERCGVGPAAKKPDCCPRCGSAFVGDEVVCTRCVPVAPAASECRSLRERLKDACADAERRRRVEDAARAVAEDCEQALQHHDTKGKGGQQVSYSGPFSSGIVPSNLRTLREWAGMLRAALAEKGTT